MNKYFYLTIILATTCCQIRAANDGAARADIVALQAINAGNINKNGQRINHGEWLRLQRLRLNARNVIQGAFIQRPQQNVQQHPVQQNNQNNQ